MHIHTPTPMHTPHTPSHILYTTPMHTLHTPSYPSAHTHAHTIPEGSSGSRLKFLVVTVTSSHNLLLTSPAQKDNASSPSRSPWYCPSMGHISSCSSHPLVEGMEQACHYGRSRETQKGSRDHSGKGHMITTWSPREKSHDHPGKGHMITQGKVTWLPRERSHTQTPRCTHTQTPAHTHTYIPRHTQNTQHKNMFSPSLENHFHQSGWTVWPAQPLCNESSKQW